MLKHQKSRTNFLSLLLLALAFASAPPANAQDGVVAKVNGRAITEADVRLAEAEIGADLQNYPAATRRRVIIEFLIENELFAEAAASKNVAASPVFKERKHYWDRRSLRDSYFDTQIRSQITDSEARAFYDAQLKSFKGGEEVRASHILVKSEDEAKAIFEQIAHDGDFAELAAKHSTDPGSKANGGDLGYFGRGRMVPEFEKAAFATPVGEVALPIKSQFGWHIIKVTDKRNRKPPTFEALKERIVTRLMRDKAKQLADALRKKATVEYLDPTVKNNGSLTSHFKYGPANHVARHDDIAIRSCNCTSDAKSSGRPLCGC